MSDRNGGYGDYSYRGRGYLRGYRGHFREHHSRGNSYRGGRGGGGGRGGLSYYEHVDQYTLGGRGGGVGSGYHYRGGNRGGYRGYDSGGAPTTTNNGSYSNEQHYSPQTTATGPNSGSGSGIGPGTGSGTGRITGTAPGSSSSSQVSGSNTNVSPNPSHDSRSTTPLPTRNRLRSQSTNPWIQLLHIKDEHTRTTLQQRYLELEEVDARLMELQKSRLAMESAAKTLEIYAAKEALNVSITNDKLEEFTYF